MVGFETVFFVVCGFYNSLRTLFYARFLNRNSGGK